VWAAILATPTRKITSSARRP